jgi:hypothetical protein
MGIPGKLDFSIRAAKLLLSAKSAESSELIAAFNFSRRRQISW